MAKFKKEALQDLVDGNNPDLYPIKDEVTGNSRWSIQHTLLFQEKATGRFYRTHYSTGATEMQSEEPFEDEGEEVEVQEVVPVQRTVTVYEPVPKQTTTNEKTA